MALVYAIEGEATQAGPNRVQRPIRLYDRLAKGAVVTTGADGRLSLAFVNGRRYELGPDSRATFSAADLAQRSGSVRSLPAVPALLLLLPIADEEKAGSASGAVRIRGERIGGLSPCCGAATLAAETVLRFDPVAGGGTYRVAIEDTRGAVIFQVETRSPVVAVAAGTLTPGIRYHWTVKTLDRPGPVASGEAGFATLSRQAEEARDRLLQAVEASPGDAGLRALLTAVDHALRLAAGEVAVGAVIESVAPGSPGEEAGLQPGDRIFSWSCAATPPGLPSPAGGRVSSPYDLLLPEGEEAPRRPVVLSGWRGAEKKTWVLNRGEWGLRGRPEVPEGIVRLYDQGASQIAAGDLVAAGRSWRAAADTARAAGDGRLAAWFLDRWAEALAAARAWDEADAAHGEALEALKSEAQALAAAQLLRRWGDTYMRRADWESAAARSAEALTFHQRQGSPSLGAARTLDQLGIVFAEKGDLASAESRFRESLAIREELAPGTTEMMASFNNLGILARRRGDLSAAEEYLTRGEELQRRLAPGNRDHAMLFQNLGNVARDRGDLDRAEGFFRQALTLFEKNSPGGQGVADSLALLGRISLFRGDLATAEDRFRKALAIQEQSAPDALVLADFLIDLGNLEVRRGDLDAAGRHYERARGLCEKLSPVDAGRAAVAFGLLAAARGDFAAARMHLQTSLELAAKVAPGSLDEAESAERVGRLEIDSRGDLVRAERLLRQALAIYEDKAPVSLNHAEILRDLGEAVALRGGFAEALALLRRSLELQQKLAPGATDEAVALHLLGRTERLAGHDAEATEHFCRATIVLDHQRTRLGGTQEGRSFFEASIGEHYFACLDGLIGLGRTTEAFHALERGRARSFLALLAERDLRLADLPPGLAAERRQVDLAYDRVQAQLAHLDAGRSATEIERLSGELGELRRRQEEIVTRLRRESPRTAAMEAPQPLDLPAVRAILDPGTVLLEYAVGSEATWLFVVQPVDATGPAVSVFRIAAGAKALRDEVESFRRLLGHAGSDRAALRDRARRLYRLLVQPAEPRIAGARRLLLSADGPLHTLPFAALLRRERHLIEWKPLHFVLSATVYAELARSRRTSREPGADRLAAFGDPVYPSVAPGSPADPEIRDALRRGATLSPLPSTRREVEAIVALFPQAEAYLGRDATEERAKSLGKEPRLIHFACHGLLDERFPLNSALALTLPESPGDGQGNGLLQAWEIFESLRLDADLVTLSACGTALGKEMGGEGLIGLTRAFQYAGARSVLATLWSVSDTSTADLMQRFYGHLRIGRPKTEALQAAQVELIRSGRLSHPYHWAAFQLSGDGR
ncbi:MAG TPA: hypothetical protein DD490_31585 [Acidobacteria bacterium]|nr:hypothetical protein [Acidobacteriota bacterium]